MAASKMAAPKPERAPADIAAALLQDDTAFAAAIGALLRSCRAKRGMTRSALARRSGTSERYLAQIESGQGNPSVFVLKSIAEALGVAITELLPSNDVYAPALDRIVQLLARVPESELPALAESIERLAARSSARDRARRIALVGLRGAGKSTLGSMLAQHLGCPFIELDRLVEQDYGARVPDIIEIAGQATFRRHERACLERVIATHASAVIATAGGIVSSAETYGFLLRHTHAIWIKAQPEEHMRRVMAQGDFRPMAENGQAMADLVAILEARGSDYARADALLETSDDTVEESFRKLRELAGRILGGATETAL